MIHELKSLPDDSLVALFKQGSSEAFGVLLSRYEAILHTYIRIQVGTAAVAEDLFQDTFMKVIDRIRSDKYTYQGKFKSWLLRIAHNLLIDYFRHKKVMNTISVDEEDDSRSIVERIASDEPTIEEVLSLENDREEVRRWLNNLSYEQREIVELRFKEDLSFKEIAEETGISINTALGRMRYALINLRKLDAVSRFEY